MSLVDKLAKAFSSGNIDRKATPSRSQRDFTPAVTRYFKRILERGQLESVSFERGKSVMIPLEDIHRGSLDEKTTKKLFELDNSNIRAKNPKPVELVISLVTYSPPQEEHHGLLLLSAELDNKGKLTPKLDPGKSPWIPSERLSTPHVSDLELMVGSLQSFRTHVIKSDNCANEPLQFSEAVTIALTMFQAVSGKTPSEFQKHYSNQFNIETAQCFIKLFQKNLAVRALLNLYTFLENLEKPASVDNPVSVPLYERMIQGSTTAPIPDTEIDARSGLRKSALKTCASMSDSFPLTDSQRLAVHGFLRGTDGDVTAVSGPAGTGKTTMLQAVVANLLTQRALDKADAPVIVGMSTNNQAVTNIIQSFASVTKKQPGAVDFRWLPEAPLTSAPSGSPDLSDLGISDSTSDLHPLPGLAVYCPSSFLLEEASKNFLVETAKRDKTYPAYTNQEYLESAEIFFWGNAQKVFPNLKSLDDAADTIHQKLANIDFLRQKLIRAKASERNRIYNRTLKKLLKDPVLRAFSNRLGELQTCKTLTDLDKTLDITLRYAEFWLALHYFEAKWLEIGRANGFIKNISEQTQTSEFQIQYWKQAAFLTPCFVMTCYQLPKYFRISTRQGAIPKYDTGRIDLLIVDESGQVDTPVGIPAFALAKRALVVGDEKQLPPVWSIDPETDREEAKAFKIFHDEWLNYLAPRGLTASAKSSLMRAAAHASAFTYGNGKPGLFLSEHFRCHERIISFCNELVYDGMLKPMRQSDKHKLPEGYSPFMFYTVADSKDDPVGSSRKNDAEAKAIARWIADNFARLFEIYNPSGTDANEKVPADKLIGVVTPFRAQANNITRALKDIEKKRGQSCYLLKGLAEKITVGTAHRLQGAERPIVLFSAVYGEKSPNASFINDNPELMNVAVSRAKDLFIVFAAKNRWLDQGTVFSKMTQFATRVPLDREEKLPSRIDPTSEDTAANAASFLSISKVIFLWKKNGRLKPEDETVQSKEWNQRLRDAGILQGRSNAWELTEFAQQIGAQVFREFRDDGSCFDAIKYSPDAQDYLLGLYRHGKL